MLSCCGCHVYWLFSALFLQIGDGTFQADFANRGRSPVTDFLENPIFDKVFDLTVITLGLDSLYKVLIRKALVERSGSGEVWGALMASTATTVVIFIPIMFLNDVSGQLFSDLALVISVAVIASLVIAVTVIPAAASRWLKDVNLHDPHDHWWESATQKIMRATDTDRRRKTWVAGLFAGATALTWALIPPADYLPKGEQGWIFAYVLMPPGQGVNAGREEFGSVVIERMDAYLQEGSEPQLNNYFMGMFSSSAFAGGRTVDPDDSDAFVDILNDEILAGFPDTMAFAQQWGIFDQIGGGGALELNIQSRDMDAMLAAGRAGLGLIAEHLPDAQVRPIPGVDLSEPELRLAPNERRITEAGWNRREISTVVPAVWEAMPIR